MKIIKIGDTVRFNKNKYRSMFWPKKKPYTKWRAEVVGFGRDRQLILKFDYLKCKQSWSPTYWVKVKP